VREYSYWLDTQQSPVTSRQSSVESHQSSVESHQSSVENARSLIASRRFDAVVVGAGYTGLSAARQLAGAGATVLVVERERIGWGASSRNGGQVLTGLKVDPATLVARYGEARARQLFDVARESMARLETVIAGNGIACNYEHTGHLQAASKPAHFEAFRDEQALLARVFDHRVELVSRTDQRSEVGSDIYHGLLVDERSGALNPARYVDGLATAAARAGASIATGVAVTGVRHDAGRWVVSTSAGEIETRDVLFATNGYADHAAPALQRRFVSIGSYIVATAPLAPDQASSILPRRRVAFDSKYFLHYFRLTDDRRLLFGGRAEFSQPDSATTGRAADILRRDLATVFPQLAGVPIDYAWGGAVAFTRDQMPRAGMLDGLYYAGGYSGHGVAMATYLGELIARRMAGEPIDHPLFDDDFAAIPMYSGTPWFLPVVGAYYQVKDWLL
jgi:glycine/D-amino acid oxidase-like deaminating enzyme